MSLSVFAIPSASFGKANVFTFWGDCYFGFPNVKALSGLVLYCLLKTICQKT